MTDRTHTPTSPGDLAKLERALGITFRQKALLQLALVHGSYVNEHADATPESNERLEFLGDAVLDMLVGEEVYKKFPDAPEGELTVLRAQVVKDESLAHVASRIGVGTLLLLGQGEEATGGRTRPSNLAAAIEALIAAAFLDQGYEAAKKMTLHLLSEDLAKLSDQHVPTDPKSVLQGLAQQQGHQAPLYRLVREFGPDHAKEFEVEVLVDGVALGSGRGRRKSEAEREAAAQALSKLSPHTS